MKNEPLHFESTPRCMRLPALLFAAEELQRDYDVTFRPEGWFETNHGGLGPLTTIDDRTILGLDASLLALADDTDRDALAAWIDFHATTIRPAIVAARRAPDGVERLQGALAELESRVTPGAFIGARFQLADCLNIPLTRVRELGVEPGPLLTAYAEKLAARDAWHRVRAFLENRP